MENPTTSHTVNRIARLFVLTQTPAGEHLEKDLKTRGFDGTVWLGFSKGTGRKKDCNGLFYRSQSGTFQAVL